MHTRRSREQLAEKESVVMDEIWQALPEDLHEKILPFIPIPDLCRFRLVCTKWADLITQPAFAATTKHKASYLLMSADRVKPAKSKDKVWEICDTATHKHYKLSQDFLLLLPPVTERLTLRYGRYGRSTIAADKGFICVLWQKSNQDEAIFVVNPITKSFQELPCFERTSPTLPDTFGQPNPCIAMVVANDLLSFKIFVLQEASQDPLTPDKQRCFVFDSRVGEWRAFSQPPSRYHHQVHMLLVGSILYAIFQHFRCDRCELHAYDTDLDVWTNTEVIATHPMPPIMIPQLVACSGRLFLTAWHEEMENLIMIWEIDVLSNEITKVAKTSGLITVGGLIPNHTNRYGSRLSPCVDYLCYTAGANVRAFGTSDGRIIFTSVTGKSVAYRLATNSWQHVEPGWSSFDLHCFASTRASLFGSAMDCITLCPVPVVTAPVVPVPMPNNMV